MSRDADEDQMDTKTEERTKKSGETNSGTPNPDDPNKTRSTEHKSGYGGEGGDPRTSSDERGRKEK